MTKIEVFAKVIETLGKGEDGVFELVDFMFDEFAKKR